MSPSPSPSPLTSSVATAVHTTADLTTLLDAVASAMSALGYPVRDVFGVRLALEEAVVNAIKHGHGYDPAKAVRVRYAVAADRVWAEVQDEGPGFDPSQVADPLQPENLERPCGRGLLLMRHFLTSVEYSRRGSRVTLRKARSGT